MCQIQFDYVSDLLYGTRKQIKEKTLKSLICMFNTIYRQSSFYTVFFLLILGRTLNLTIKVQTLQLTNFNGLECKAFLQVLTLSRNILRRATNRVRFISLYPFH